MDIYEVLSQKQHDPHYLKKYINFIKNCLKTNMSLDIIKKSLAFGDTFVHYHLDIQNYQLLKLYNHKINHYTDNIRRHSCNQTHILQPVH